MISGIVSLLGSGGAGALLGIAKYLITVFVQSKREKNEFEHERFLAMGKLGNERLSELNKQPNEVELDSSKQTKLKIGKFEASYDRVEKKERLVYGLASLAHNAALFVLVCTLTVPILIWADNPNVLVTSFNPSAEPTSVSLFFGILDFKFDKTQIANLTTGGLAFILLHGIMGIVGYILVGNTSYRK